MDEDLKQSSREERSLKHIMLQLNEFFKAHYVLRYNTLDNRCEFRPAESDVSFRAVGERDMNRFVIEALNEDITCMDRDVRRYVHSTYIAEYHPLRSYIEQLPAWDGKDRVEVLARRVTGNRSWIKHFHRWMLGMVAQWTGRNNGYGNCLMPILISQEQGLKKSSFCKNLLPPELQKYYLDDFDISSRSNVGSRLAKFALINIDEIDRFGPQKMARLKNILQEADVKLKKMGSNEFDNPGRLASLIATSNRVELLTDPTGSRRELPVVMERRIRSYSIHHQQIYAQLKEELDAGKRSWLMPDEERRLTVHNKAFCRRPIDEAVFYECFRLPAEGEECMYLSMNAIYEQMKKKSPSTMRDVAMGSFGEHLAMIGVKKIHRHTGYVYCVVKLS